MRDLVIIGAGGFGREVSALAKSQEPYWESVSMINSDQKLSYAAYVVVAIGDPKTRRMVVNQFDDKYRWARLFHATSQINGAVINKGTIICQNAIISVNCKIGKHVHINFACTIGHDCIIGDFVTISPGVHISGNVTIGDEVFIGTGAVIREKLTIGEGATIGMGAVVVKDVPAGVTVVGNPAKVMK